MRKTFFYTALCLSLLLQAQNEKWSLYPLIGIDMGGAVPFPLSDIPKGSKGTPKLNPNLGLGFSYRLHKKWNVGLEISYHILSYTAKADVRSQAFYFNNHQDILYFSGSTSTNVELRFLELPLVADYKMGENWEVSMGAYYSKILDGTFKTEGTNGILSDNKTITDTASLPGIATARYDFNEFIDSWDSGILVGFRYNLNHRLNFWTRLQVGFNSIFVSEFNNIDYEMYQVRLNVGVSIALFKKP